MATQAVKPTAAKKKRALRQNTKPLLLIALPGILYLLINNYLPMIGIFLAFKDYSYIKGPFKSNWCGFKNFEFLFRSDAAFTMIRNTLAYNIVFIITTTVLAITLAIMMNELNKLTISKFFQGSLLLPNLVSMVIVSYLVYAFLNPESGLLNNYFKQIGIGSYVLSGDNYPRRYPALNDAERLRIFRQGGMHGLTSGALLNPDVWQQLHTWQIEQRDADPTLCADVPWLAVYQAEGRKALAGYLGTPSEQDFDELGQTLARFKNGIDAIWLKRMGRDDAALWYDKVDFSQVKVLIVEWTHGNSDFYCGVDLPVFLYSTPQETMTYRVSRARDGAADSPFVTMVLQIEQRLLESQAHKAKIILSREGKVLSWSEYCKLAVS